MHDKLFVKPEKQFFNCRDIGLKMIIKGRNPLDLDYDEEDIYCFVMGGMRSK